MEAFQQRWHRITELEGEALVQVRGKRFTFSVHGNMLTPSTTNRNLPRSSFETAYARLPVDGPGELQDLQGPSYLYAILTDGRVLETR